MEDNAYRVVEPYAPVHDGEIDLTVGDVIANVKDLGNGWALGRNVSQGTVGIFPCGFLLPIADQADSTWNSCADDNVIQNNHTHIDAPQGHEPGYQTLNRDKPSPVRSEPEQVPSPFPSNNEDDGIGYVNRPVVFPLPPHINEADRAPPVISDDYSLPTRKRKTTRKPQISVKPNMGKNRFQPQPHTSPPVQHRADKKSILSLDTELLNNPLYRTMQAATSSIPPPPPSGMQTFPRSRTPSGKLENEANDVHEAVIENRNVQTTPEHHGFISRSTDAIDAEFIGSPMIELPLGSTNDLDREQSEPMDHQNIANETLHNGNIGGAGSDRAQINGFSPQLRNKQQRLAEIHRAYYRDYRTLECPPNEAKNAPQLRYKPVLKGKAGPYGDPRTREIAMRKPESQNTSQRLIVSILAGLLCGGILFLWMYYYLEYAFVASLFVSGIASVLLIIVFALSRLCRCIGALIIPSICTTRGRLSFLILITGFLIGGPVTDIYHNMREISHSMSCSAEQSFNQSMLLLQPFDNMMAQLNTTVKRLQFASRNVSSGLVPLDDGLDRVEMDIYDGRYNLMGTQRTCNNMVDTALKDCESGIAEAQSQCLGVIDALGTVYHQARDVLDSINPERFAGKHAAQLHKRQTVYPNGQGPTGDNKDICEPLENSGVCQSLNDTDKLCQGSGWAGVAIQDAINATQEAMKTLRKTLHFEVHPEPYYNARVNASKVLYKVRTKVQREFYMKTQYFDLTISILKKIIPAAILILIYVAYTHVKNFVSKDTYDNVYITLQFKTLDQKRSEVAGESLLPLKKYERNYLIDATTSDLSPPEDGLYRIGMCVLLLHFLLAFTIYLFDYILFWILALIRRHSDPNYDVTGRDTLELVITGEGVITDLLHIFLKGFHPANLFGYTVDTQACLPSPRAPSIVTLLVIFFLYFALVLTILLKAYILRGRNKITAYFYPDREKARIVHLYNAVLNSRLRMPKLLQHKAKLHFREKVLRDQVSISHTMAAKVPPFRPFVTEQGKCLVCSSVEDQTFRDCQTEKCQGLYCSECYEDLGRICPLCLHSPDYCEDDEYDYEELEADDLQPYHRSSKIYV